MTPGPANSLGQAPDGDPTASVRPASGRSKAALDEVFGDVLPDTTRDESDSEDRSPSRREPLRDRELRRDVPPHHG